MLTSISIENFRCFEKLKKALKDKDLVKLWINHYQRYDTLARKNRKDAFTKWENVMKHRSDIFDFSKDEIIELKQLKDFLTMFLQIQNI